MVVHVVEDLVGYSMDNGVHCIPIWVDFGNKRSVYDIRNLGPIFRVVRDEVEAGIYEWIDTEFGGI